MYSIPLHPYNIQVRVKTTAYVGLGLSGNGGMAGADIVVGWVKDGEALLYVCTKKTNNDKPGTTCYQIKVPSSTMLDRWPPICFLKICKRFLDKSNLVMFSHNYESNINRFLI